jgi:UDP-N-acetyl-D-glucosamine dehydrogenase
MVKKSKKKSSLKDVITAFKAHKATVGVVGMGYVGLPLAMEFGKKQFKVIGFDIDDSKVKALNAGKSYIKHIPTAEIARIRKSGNFEATTEFSRISESDAILICVPTPLGLHNEPDISYIEITAKAIAPFIRSGQLIALESTTYPGTTEEVLIPILEKSSGLKAGVDFWVAFSPEREDPNNKDYSTSTIPKVVGGFTPDCLKAACTLYDQIIIKTIPVSSCATAEATKILENVFRSVNIALANELKTIFSKMGIDVWEVIEAAKSKPFGYMPFYPGPGLGGHCIPIDPFYLTWKAHEFGVSTRFIELAGEINTSMPEYVVNSTLHVLNQFEKSLKGSKVLIVGLAYKADIDDMRESPSLRLIELYEAAGAKVSYYDPYIPVIPPTREHSHLAGRKSIKLSDVGKFDVAVISTKHTEVDHTIFARKCEVVIDTRNALDKSLANVFKA